jgi:hypothetical protein
MSSPDDNSVDLADSDKIQSLFTIGKYGTFLGDFIFLGTEEYN